MKIFTGGNFGENSTNREVANSKFWCWSLSFVCIFNYILVFIDIVHNAFCVCAYTTDRKKTSFVNKLDNGYLK